MRTDNERQCGGAGKGKGKNSLKVACGELRWRVLRFSPPLVVTSNPFRIGLVMPSLTGAHGYVLNLLNLDDSVIVFFSLDIVGQIPGRLESGSSPRPKEIPRGHRRVSRVGQNTVFSPPACKVWGNTHVVPLHVYPRIFLLDKGAVFRHVLQL